jgi:predicted DNA-binding transcriptional regulator YafY
MRASRLVSLLLLLQTRGRMTAQQLADELEVSVRTIYRDVESLGSTGVPVYGDPGRAGGYQLLDGYRTRLTGISGDEAEALFLTGLPGPAAELGLGAVVAAAQLKLMAALPEPVRDRADRTQQRFHLDAPGWYTDAEQTPHLAAVADAVWHEQQIEVRYRRWAAPEEVTRRLAPYGLVLKAGRWYLVARSDEQIRTYRVSQILRVTMLDQAFERPAGFALAAYWRAYLDEFEARRHQGCAVVRLSRRGVAALSDPAVRRAVEDSAGAPDRDGWVTATIPIESVEHATGQVLRLGAQAEVLSPPELRARIAQTVDQLAARYHADTRPAVA